MKQANNKRPNLRELPAYSVAEVAHYLNIPKSTVRYWAMGKDFPALIEVADTILWRFRFSISSNSMCSRPYVVNTQYRCPKFGVPLTISEKTHRTNRINGIHLLVNSFKQMDLTYSLNNTEGWLISAARDNWQCESLSRLLYVVSNEIDAGFL